MATSGDQKLAIDTGAPQNFHQARGDSLAELIPEGLLAGRRTTGEQPQPRTRRNRGSSESPGHPGRDRAIHQLLVLGVAGDLAT